MSSKSNKPEDAPDTILDLLQRVGDEAIRLTMKRLKKAELSDEELAPPVWAGANDNRESQALASGIQKNGQGLDAGAGLFSGVRPTGAGGRGRDGGVNYSILS